VGLDVSHHLLFLEQVRKRLWIDIYFAVIVAALFAVFAAHRGLAPLRRVTATARNLSADGLGERLAERRRTVRSSCAGDRLQRYAGATGIIISPLVRFLCRYCPRVAHARLEPDDPDRGRLSHARSPDEYREVLASNLEEYERIARMVSDMLFLAQAENGVLPRSLEAVNLADEARALIDFYEALAEEKEVRIVLAGEASVTGDRLMIRRALSNLLSNALRHSRSGSLVEISITVRLAWRRWQ
jgi:two-component system heavy metal sensor histidine kinase CusS